jgi:hypothetical protein
VRGVSFRLTLATASVSSAFVLPVGPVLAWLLTQAAATLSAPTPPAPLEPPAPLAAPTPLTEPASRPHIRAVRTPAPPVIDGKLDDPAWRLALPSDTFTQHFPDEGAPPSERTEVRILYDDDAIYVGIDCEQWHVPVVKRLMRRDTQLPSDGVWLDIDSRRDGLSAFHFSVNAAGVLGDAIHFNDLDYSSDWDAVWEGKAADTPRGYSVEMRIPLYVLRFEALPVQDWGLQVRRFIEARQETDDWSFYSRGAGSYVPLFGRVDDLAALSPHRALQLRPFVLGRVRHRAADASAATATLAHGTDAALSAGLDVKAAITNELTLDLALEPDFGQVEADTVVLNLSTYETFFPEKRPFFLEGIDTFATIRPLLYTRRIGHQPASPTLATGETLVDLPDPSPIYGAAKLVGTIGGRTTLGVLSAVTGENDVSVLPAPPNATTVSREAEPLTAYNVLRLRRLVGPDATVGLLATATNRFESLYAPGQTCGETGLRPASDQRCTNDAYVASADGRWRSPGGDYAVGAQAVTTALAHGPARAEPDGISVKPGTPSGSGTLTLDKVGGAHWLWSVYQQVSGRGLEFNDLGYLDRKDDYLGAANVTYRTIEPWWKTVETRTTLSAEVRRTLDGINLVNSTALGTLWTFSNFWGLYAQADLRGATHDDREMGDGTALERAARWGLELAVSGNPRRRVLWSVYGQALQATDGRHLEAHGQVTVRVRPQLELDFLPTATSDEGEPRYLATTTTMAMTTDPTAPTPTTYLLGAQEARSLGATLRAAYTFTPELSLQVYSQAFLARVHYTRFFDAPLTGFRQRVDLAALLPAAAPPTNYDSLSSTLNVNIVLRWEFRLGSTAFLVYTRAQTPALVPATNGATSLDLRPIATGRAATDVIMLKLAYWWG